jgi:ATP-binding cassette, subfamily B, bacterial
MLTTLAWPTSKLGDALSALARHADIGTPHAQLANPVQLEQSGNSPDAVANWDAVAKWIDWAASRLGCEAEPVEMTFGDLERELTSACPSVLRVDAESFLVVLGARRHSLRVLGPEGSVASFPVRKICDLICAPWQQTQSAQWDRLLEEAEIPQKKRARTLNLLTSEARAGQRFDQCWILRSKYKAETGGSVFRLLREANATRNASGLVIAKIAQYLLWLASWAVLGSLSFSGHMDRGWLTAWALLLITLIPFQAATTWLQGLFAIGLGGFLKRRLLAGALQLEPEEIRHWGIGSFLSQALEAGSMEALAVSGGIAGLLGVVELAVSAFLLGPLALLLAAWTALTAFITWRFGRRWEHSTVAQMQMTHELIENMVGHRTRLAQQRPSAWHQEEDAGLQRYLDLSNRVDRTGIWLVAAIPRGWLLVGLAGLLPSLIGGQNASSQTAILLGGILLAYTAFRKVTASFSQIALAWAAWKRIRPLFDAAGKHSLPSGVSTVPKAAPGEKVIEADALAFRYRSTGNPALRGCSLTIRQGERLLLQGPSGGGKTTFASLLSGLRQPESGLLLANGLDRHTLGANGWRRCVAAAPQFHENHILTETLAFNVLMGRRWPATASDIQEAETICRELGLGNLLNRMPSGMLQMVGEGGWQLSHGEKSRVYIARALLQAAELVILDESFAALDPENLGIAMQCTLKRAKTLLVIAHP